MSGLPEVDIARELKRLYQIGFLKSLRASDTGIGYTLETVLNIKENNEGEPDFVYHEIPVELKAQRIGASSRITLITKTPCWEPLSQKEIIEKYGYKDVKGRQGLKITLTTSAFNPKGFKLEINRNNNRLNVVHKEYGIVAYYDIFKLMEKIRRKIFSNLILVLAETRKKDKNEYFQYQKAILLQDLSENKFEEALNNGIIVWEFRAHIKPDGTVRDHGPGFRISKLHLSNLYSKQTIIFDGSKPSEEQR